MVERFLRYSLENSKKIRIALLTGGAVRTLAVQVVSIGEGAFFALLPRRKTPQEIRLEDVLSAGYARGDEGMTE